MYLNRIAKIEEDSRRFLEKVTVFYSPFPLFLSISRAQAKRQIEEMDMERCDLLHLQQNFNLTWVPDELVHFCANSKCSKAFTAVRTSGRESADWSSTLVPSYRREGDTTAAAAGACSVPAAQATRQRTRIIATRRAGG